MTDREELIEWLWQLADGPESPPTKREIHDHPDAPSLYHYREQFGSVTTAFWEAGFDEGAVSERGRYGRTWLFDRFPQAVSLDAVVRTPTIIGTELTMTYDGDTQTVSTGQMSVDDRLVTIDGFELAVTDRGEKGWIVRLTRKSDEHLVWLDDFIEFCDESGVNLG
jgi:hypothetical protein